MGEGRLNAESRSALHAERISAAAPLIAASRRPSVTSCLRIRARLAPSARSHADFALPFRGARQQQAGHVEARDQEHDPDHRQPDPRDPRHHAELGHALAHREEGHAAAGVGLRVRQRQLAHDAAEIGLCLRRRDPRLQAAGEAQPLLAAGGQRRRESEQIEPIEREPQVGLVETAESLESLGNHPGDREQPPVQRQRAPGDRGAAEPLFPETLADDHRRVRPGAVRLGDQTAQQRPRPQGGEVVA